MKSLLIALVLSVLITTGFTCAAKLPPDAVKFENQSEVRKLFTHKGCDVYKFYDEVGNRGYYTNCNGSTSWQETHRQGKTSVTEDYTTAGGK